MKNHMRFDVLTLFPQMFEAVLGDSIIGRARENNILEMNFIDIRDFSTNKHMKVDDYPYGGGAGMVMQAEPVYGAWKQVTESIGYKPRVIYLTPQGKVLNQTMVEELALEDDLVLLCGHYEGIDERVIEAFADEEISIGDYILTGGELASLVVADSVLRLKPGVLAEQKGYEEESYWDGLLEYPQYTRPEVWEGRAVPDVLLGGDHQKIDAWRGEKSRERTRLRRPELYEQWCETHPITELPKWKRGENVRLVRTEEQYQAAAKLFCEGRRTICAGNWTAEYCAGLREEAFLAQLKAEKKEGWACYLHTTKDVPDGMVSVDHKTGRIEHLFVAADARGKGIGQKMLDFARKKLEEHEHPTLTVLDQNTRAIALYRRMGWKLTGEAARVFDPAEDGFVQRRCELLVMRWEG